MEKQVNNDEINLVELLVKILMLLKRNLFRIIIFILVGMGLGYAFTLFVPKSYESKMMINSYILTESYGEKIFETLQGLIEEKNYEVLMEKLNLEEESVAALDEIIVESIFIESILKDNPLSNDNPLSIEAKTFFLITVQLSNPSFLPNLEKGILSFLRQNEFVKVRDEQKKKSLETLIAKMKTEMESLEKFKDMVQKDFFLKDRNKDMGAFDPTEINSKIMEFMERKREYEIELLEANSIQLVEGFTQFKEPIWPKKLAWSAIGAALGFFLVGVIIVFESIRKFVLRFTEEQSGQAVKS